MAGETPDDPRTGRPDEFMSKTKWERFQILIMGPVMNIVLAVVVMAVVLAQGAEVPVYQDQPPVVGAVGPGSPAEEAGILPGDLILDVAGRPVDTWEDLFIAVGTRPDRDVCRDVAPRGADAIGDGTAGTRDAATRSAASA